MKNATTVKKKKMKRNSVTRSLHKSLINRIRMRQATYFGHVMRREKLEHLVTTGKIEGIRSKGKQREKMLDGLTKVAKRRRSDRCIKGLRCVEGHDGLRYN